MTLSRTMMNIFLEWLQQFFKVFVDDFNIHSITQEDHFNHIRTMLKRLKDVNLKLNPNKCVFFAKIIRFLGHVVGKARTQPNPNKVKAIVEFLVPKTITNIHAFLGLTNYYHNYIQSYAKILTFLFELMKRDATF